jgi:hypothetical protein
MPRGAVLISIAILIAAYWIASLFRYEYADNRFMRTDRWSGNIQVNCAGPGIGWVTLEECNAAVKRKQQDAEGLDGIQWDK